MKVYVLGDDRERVVRLSNFINSTGGTAIMSEHVPSDYSELVEDMLGGDNRDFDLIVAISKQPIETSIEANRSGKLRAVVCRNPKEAAMARKAHTNVIVLDRNDFEDEDAGDIVEAWLGAPEQRATAEDAHAIRQNPIRQGQHTNVLGQLFSFANQKTVRKKRRSAERTEEEDQDEIPKPKGKGIIKNIKYTFGIE
jgi:ribose 5-phosphate isomerase RpiB